MASMGRGGVLAPCRGDRSGGGLGADARLPLGMYAVAGMYLGRVDDLPIVEWTGRAWLEGRHAQSRQRTRTRHGEVRLR